MKKLIALFLCLIQSPVWGTIARVNKTNKITVGTTVTIPSTTLGNLIIVILSDGNTGTFTSAPTDDKGNTYTAFTGYNNFNPSVDQHGEAGWYGWTVDAFGGVTVVTYLNPGSTTAISVVEYSSTNGWPANPTDQTNTNHVGGGAPSATFTSNATPTLSQASELLFGSLFIKAVSGPWTIGDDSPFLNVDDTGFYNGDTQINNADVIVSATTGLAFTGTLSPSIDYGATVMSFKDNPDASVKKITIVPGTGVIGVRSGTGFIGTTR